MAVFIFIFFSSKISFIISIVQSTWGLAPEPPAEPIITGILSSYPAWIISSKSFFAAFLLTIPTPAPNLCGPASVEPASTAIKSGFLFKPLKKDSFG